MECNPDMNETLSPVISSFNYSSLQGTTADWLRGKTDRLRGYLTLTAGIAVKIGIELQAVKGRIEKGKFREWVRSELPWSSTQVKRFMRIARVFGDAKQIELYCPSALYVLCDNTAPIQARMAAIEIVEAGQKVTHTKARELVALYRPSPPDLEENSDADPYKPVASSQGKRMPKPTEQTVGDRNWADLLDVLGEYDTLHISHLADEENGFAEFAITAYPKDPGKPIARFNRGELSDAFSALLGDEKTKICPVCEAEKPFDRFCINRTDVTGRNRICRDCESQRRVASRAAEKATQTQPPEPV